MIGSNGSDKKKDKLSHPAGQKHFLSSAAESRNKKQQDRKSSGKSNLTVPPFIFLSLSFCLSYGTGTANDHGLLQGAHHRREQWAIRDTRRPHPVCLCRITSISLSLFVILSFARASNQSEVPPVNGQLGATSNTCEIVHSLAPDSRYSTSLLVCSGVKQSGLNGATSPQVSW